ncbi:MAG TPA: ATP-binding protein [Candidatus Angelobacter sp.]|jgi:hypothetical protein|nr:ATP-binding protein [Candidatus Angelobacter sp.]
MDGTRIRQINESQNEVQRLTHRTLLSLLQCFDHDQTLFYPSVQEQEINDPPTPTVRDSALALMAIEEARDSMSRRRDTPTIDLITFEQELQDNLKSCDGAKLKPISYYPYRNLVFNKTLKYITARDSGKVYKILGNKAERDSIPRPFQQREAFTCACILSLLNTYPRGSTHTDVYMEALDTVLEELVRPYPPHYLFGGASLTRTEPHAFVAYMCLRSLAGLAEVVKKRAKEHLALADLIGEMDRWLSNNEEHPIRKLHNNWSSFEYFVAESARSFENPVGLRSVIEKLKSIFPIDPVTRQETREVPASNIAAQLIDALKNGFTEQDPTSTGTMEWLNRFAGLVEKKLSEIDRIIGEQYIELNNRWEDIRGHSGRLAEPGRISMEVKRAHLETAGTVWRRAFFEGMRYVLKCTQKSYETLTANGNLTQLAFSIRNAGEQWMRSAERTKRYVAKFAKWARAELNRQISLHAAKVNFDPVQLAFALRICHDLDPEIDKDVLTEGLEIVLKKQEPDGTWPSGAPFVYFKNTLAAVYVANLEIMNAVMPLIIERDVSRYHSYVERVFQWLQANRRDVPFHSRKHSVVGWSTDRIYDTGRIDLWMTAAALKFLVSYRALLQGMVNLEIAQTYDLSTPKLKWSEIVDSELQREYSKRVTTEIYEKFVRPFKDTGASTHSGMVLHGPPGTSKSTLAQAIANELGWNMVTITPSDFVRGGIEKSEEVARNLFKDLKILRETVVLFDELDEMLRDRSDETAQTDIAMLRFLIPGMLPKLQELKQYGEKNRLIFIIATNYIDRLDSAVVRAGRIDSQFVLVPPDESSRYCLLRKFMENKPLFKRWVPEARERTAILLARSTQGWVYKELEGLIDAVEIEAPNNWGEAPPTEDEALMNGLGKKPLDGPIRWFRTYKILERQASLNLFHFYRHREAETAVGELIRVLGSYGVKDTDREGRLKQEELIKHICGRSAARLYKQTSRPLTARAA